MSINAQPSVQWIEPITLETDLDLHDEDDQEIFFGDNLGITIQYGPLFFTTYRRFTIKMNSTCTVATEEVGWNWDERNDLSEDEYTCLEEVLAQHNGILSPPDDFLELLHKKFYN